MKGDELPVPLLYISSSSALNMSEFTTDLIRCTSVMMVIHCLQQCHFCDVFVLNLNFILRNGTVRPLLIIVVERDYLSGPISAVLYTSAVHMCTCVCVLSLCGREVV